MKKFLFGLLFVLLFGLSGCQIGTVVDTHAAKAVDKGLTTVENDIENNHGTNFEGVPVNQAFIIDGLNMMRNWKLDKFSRTKFVLWNEFEGKVSILFPYKGLIVVTYMNEAGTECYVPSSQCPTCEWSYKGNEPYALWAYANGYGQLGGEHVPATITYVDISILVMPDSH